MAALDPSDALDRERIANRPKHWVRAVTACNSRCLFCLDADTPRNLYLPVEEIKAELRRGVEELGADKVIISGGEASLHPAFVELVRYAKQELGYARVQTVTNGTMFAERAFYQAARDAGLGEITFSLHGHTEELHDWLTQTPGAFKKLMKAMIRARRDPRGPIVNVDICINKQNVAVLDRVVDLCLSVGVTEFDLLHVIPQANAYENRELMFYDVREHLPVLQKVFRLNRHPGVVVWTNRFPVHFLEGMEELIQDPHKMLDEVNGRRFMVRNYLDVGKPLECRQPERCQHCFIEPFCTTMDRRIAALREARVEVWEVDRPQDAPEELPFGARMLGLRLPDVATLREIVARLPGDHPLEVELERAEPLHEPPARLGRLRTGDPAALDAWLRPGLPLPVEVLLNRATAAWLLAHRDRLPPLLDRLHLHQPSHETLAEARAADVRDPAAFFSALALPIATSGLPACLAPGARLVRPATRARLADFEPDTGRLDIRGLAREHVTRHYKARSVRCADCPVQARCEGVPINMVRDQGLALCQPLSGSWAEEAAAMLQALWPKPPPRLADGKPLEAPHPSLKGFVDPSGPRPDPLAVTAEALGRRPRPLVKGPTRVPEPPR